MPYLLLMSPYQSGPCAPRGTCPCQCPLHLSFGPFTLQTYHWVCSCRCLVLVGPFLRILNLFGTRYLEFIVTSIADAMSPPNEQAQDLALGSSKQQERPWCLIRPSAFCNRTISEAARTLPEQHLEHLEKYQEGPWSPNPT